MFRFWAKSSGNEGSRRGHLLPYHLLDVAAVGSALLALDQGCSARLEKALGLSAKKSRSLLLFLLLIHDIGKFSGSSFQMKLPDLVRRLGGEEKPHIQFHHTSAGWLFWNKILRKKICKENFLGSMDDIVTPRETIKSFSSLIMASVAHHGSPVTRKEIEYRKIFDNHETRLALQMVELARNLAFDGDFFTTSDWQVIEKHGKQASWLVAGLIILCDWVGSDNRYFLPKDIPPESGDLSDYWKEIHVKAEQALKESGLIFSASIKSPIFQNLFPSISEPTPLQAEVESMSLPDEPALFIIEELTGSGKTEAALMLTSRLMAEGKGNGLYVALPTMATANGLYNRLAESYRRLYDSDSSPSLALAHGASSMVKDFQDSIIRVSTMESTNEPGADSATAQCAEWIADRRKATFFADVGVGTIDQAVMAVLPLRHQALRLAGLAGKILIVDEAHSYDPYLSALLQKLLQFHSANGGSVIILSATLPAKGKRKLISAFTCSDKNDNSVIQNNDQYPLITIAPKSGKTPNTIPSISVRLRRVDTSFIKTESEAVDLLIKTAQQGKCALWIRNTVHDAIAGWNNLSAKEELGQEPILFHARFSMGDRLAIEERVLKIFGKEGGENQRAGSILVATQVVEQSLDLDFDLVISDLAPIDLIIQRAGRLCRHRRDLHGNMIFDGKDQRGTPRFYILGPESMENAGENWYMDVFPKGGYVYPSHGKLWLTDRLLRQQGGWNEPADLRKLIETVYGDRSDIKIPETLEKRDYEEERKAKVDTSWGHVATLSFEEGYAPSHAGWDEETPTSKTRLGEPATTFRLAQWDGAALRLWNDNGAYQWAQSQISIMKKRLEQADVGDDKTLLSAMKMMNENAPDKGKWSIILPLQKNESGIWTGAGIDGKGGKVMIEYDKRVGLQIHKKEGNDGF